MLRKAVQEGNRKKETQRTKSGQEIRQKAKQKNRSFRLSLREAKNDRMYC